jgi:lariat debranching enzyme
MVSLDKGGDYYRQRIIEEEAWVEEHVVQAGKLAVPENFVPTAPYFDPYVPITTQDMPPEYNNPQTEQFCDLAGVENKFHQSEEESQRRMSAGQSGPR